MTEPRGFYSRGYLPHLDAGSRPQFITWRLNDSVPSHLFEEWRTQCEALPEAKRKQELYVLTERYLDEGHGSCILRSPVASAKVQDALLFYNGARYELHAWVIMPNHVHVLLTPAQGQDLTSILRPIKSYTATHIHKALGGSGALWQADFFDRLIRDEEHFHRVRKYIEWNPVKAKLCTGPEHYVYSSAHPHSEERLKSNS